jgi:RNase P subunit RPR2
MRVVPRVYLRKQLARKKFEYRHSGVIDTSRLDFLCDFRDCLPASETVSGFKVQRMEDRAKELAIDIDRRTTRGRSCPRCGGKIIPSKRAVYQSTVPNEVLSLWQCERCGYEELVEKAAKGPKKH